LQRGACSFIESKIHLIKSPPGRPQAGRKSTCEENGKKREEEIWIEGGEEDGAGRRQQFQIGVFAAFSAWPYQVSLRRFYFAGENQFFVLIIQLFGLFAPHAKRTAKSTDSGSSVANDGPPKIAPKEDGRE
jgi:hypothetical protein